MDVLVQPVLISDDGVVLVELALDDHPDYLLVVRQDSSRVVLVDELDYALTHRIDRVVQILVYHFNDRIESLLLIPDLLQGNYVVRVCRCQFLQDYVLGKLQGFVQNGRVFLQVKKPLNLHLHVLNRQQLVRFSHRAFVLAGLDQLFYPRLEPHMHGYQQLFLKPKGLRSEPQQRQCVTKFYV